MQLLGTPFTVVGYFDGTLLESLKDLDQNPITPAYLEVSQSEELSEVEIEAIQSGEEVLPKTERFRNASAEATVILPFKKCIDLGGTLKAIALIPEHGQNPLGIAADLSSWLAFPLFVGETRRMVSQRQHHGAVSRGGQFDRPYPDRDFHHPEYHGRPRP